MLRLIHEPTGREVKIGDIVRTFRDEPAKILSFNKLGMTGRVYVKLAGVERELYPSVMRLRIEEVADAAEARAEVHQEGDG